MYWRNRTVILLLLLPPEYLVLPKTGRKTRTTCGEKIEDVKIKRVISYTFENKP